MFNNIFKIVYFLEVIIASIVRKIYTAKYRKLLYLILQIILFPNGSDG